MGGVRRAGYLYDDPAGPGSGTGSGSDLPPILTWDGSARVVAQDPAPKSQFLRALEEDAAREHDDAYADDDEDEDEGGRARDDPDARRASDSDEDFDDEDDGRRRGKWGRGGGGGGGGGDAIESLRARMANHLLESTSTSTSPRGDDPSAASKRAKKAADAEAKAEAAAAAAASALESAASRLESESASWTDLSKACLHPRTARTLDGLWQGTHAFDGFGEGSEWCRSDDRREDLRDVVRRWAEECDALAGFHVAAEDLGGFGGIATAALEEIRDEHGRNVPVCVFSLRPPANADADASSSSARRVSMLNEGLASATFAPETDAYVPVCASAWTGARTLAATGLDPRGRYHASAIAAAAMDVATTPWRADGSAGCAGAESLRAVAAHLSARAPGPFAALTAYFPLAAVPDPREAAEAAEAARRRRRDAERSGSGSSSGFGGSGSSRRDGDAVVAAERDERAAADLARVFLSGGEHLTPAPGRVSNDAGGAWDSNSDAYRPLAESYAIRGAARSAAAVATPAEARGALDAALSLERARAPRLRFASAAPLPLPLPFPRVFGAPPGPNPSSAPAMTRLASAAAFGGALRATEEGWRRAARGAVGRATLRAWGVADDDAEEIGETLATMRRGYDDDDDADDFSEDELDDA